MHVRVEDWSYTRFFTTSQQYSKSYRVLFSDHGLHAGPNDCCLFGGDTFERVAQILFVVHSDRRDGDDACLCGGCRVEPAAEPGLENGEFYTSVSEREQRCHRQLFEEGRQCFELFVVEQLCGNVADCRYARREFFRTDLCARERDALSD